MTEKKWISTPITSGEFGIVDAEWIHDAEIVRLSLPTPSDRTLKIDLKSERGEEHTFEFSDVHEFACSELGMQNVVFEMLSQTGVDLANDIKAAFPNLDQERVQKLCDQVKQGSWQFAQLQPSVGCEITVIFGRLAHRVLKSN